MTGDYGLKINNIKAGSLYGYNKGIRNHYDYNKAMFHNSLFSDFIKANGMKYKKNKTLDIICLEFDYGMCSYEDELKKLNRLLSEAETDEQKQFYQGLIDTVIENEELYSKVDKDEIRKDFYENGVTVTYKDYNPDGTVKKEKTVDYKMLYRNASKAKMGQVMFINKKLYKKAYDWLTMGLGKKLPKANAKIVEISAYAPLTTSTIVGKVKIPVEDVLILNDQDSFFTTVAKVVKTEDYKDGKKKCVVVDEECEVKNTLWDGMGLVETTLLPSEVNGMVLLRNHFFKMCGFRTKIQKFFKDWCKDKGVDYNTYEVEDMFGVKHKLKDIKVITTNNAIKWLKFKDLMGNTDVEAYDYWKQRVNNDGSYFGIVKTDHESKLGKYQQMSYQMINTLPCEKEDIAEIVKPSVEYVEEIKNDAEAFYRFLRKNANAVNQYSMMADLYRWNPDIADTRWFRKEKVSIIAKYVKHLRKGKIMVKADNLTTCGNLYELLLYAVGEDYLRGSPFRETKSREYIGCYNSMFEDGERLAGFRSPHNSPNNIMYFRNVHNKVYDEYFELSKNILVVDNIETDLQSRSNGSDHDSDFFFVTNQPNIVKCAKKCYEEYPTIVNEIEESGVTYNNTLAEYAKMDSHMARAQMAIGMSSNLAQLAMTYYWTELVSEDRDEDKIKQLYDNFVILSVIAQVAIDGIKREYSVDAQEETNRISKMSCMTMLKYDASGDVYKCDFPEFMRYTRSVSATKNGKFRGYEAIKEDTVKLSKRINRDLQCPANWVEEELDKIKGSPNTKTTDELELLVKPESLTDGINYRQMENIKELYQDYLTARAELQKQYDMFDNKLDYYRQLDELFEEFVEQLSKIKLRSQKTMLTLIKIGMNDYTDLWSRSFQYNYIALLNLLYNSHKKRFMSCFLKKRG